MKSQIAALMVGAALGAGGVSIAPASITDVQKAQDTYYAEHGEYFEVHTYETPAKEKGYQLYYKKDGLQVSEGKGPESESRSFEVPLTTATTTK